MRPDTITADTFFNGKITVRQNRSGYRFSIDAVLLAHHADPGPGKTVVDLGSGCGIISMILAYRRPDTRIYGIELQKDLADMAALNVAESAMADRVSIICADMKTFPTDMVDGPVYLVVSNPPYRLANSGRVNPDAQRARARHEIAVTLEDVIQTAYRVLAVTGRLVMIYPAERITDIMTCMRSSGIEPKFLRTIHSGRRTEAKRILVEGVKGGHPGMKIDVPLIIYHQDGSYTDEVKKMFQP
jgi:tRNA1Val (adenine37-N6)-methyltransferase